MEKRNIYTWSILSFLLAVVSCDITDTKVPPFRYSYTNNSSFDIQVHTTDDRDGSSIRPNLFIEKDSTVSIIGEGRFLAPLEFISIEDITISVEYQSDSLKCVEFSGEIGDENLDPRSVNAYTYSSDQEYGLYHYVFSDTLQDLSSTCE